MFGVAVVGAAGYTGAEAVRWVLAHPSLFLAHATSGAEAGRRLSDLYPALGRSTDVVLSAPDPQAIADAASIALLAVPHTAALQLAPQLLELGMTVIDLSADYRLEDPAAYQQWYGVEHSSAGLLGEAVYGLPEMNRERLVGARLVACPGCYPTAAALAAMPALSAGVATGGRIIVDAKSGVSGAGKTPTPATHYCSADESVAAYKVAAHRHTPEMEQVFTAVAGWPTNVLFTPHLVPMNRGLLATVYIEVGDGLTTDGAVELYAAHYAGEPFVDVCAPGVMPATAHVSGTNRASVGVTVDARTGTLVAVCAIDNLGKGAAGQAIQCLNVVTGMPETQGLDAQGPVV